MIKTFFLGLLIGSVAWAGQVQPVSYDMLNGGTGSSHWWDEIYSGSGSRDMDYAALTGGLGQLTDGVVGRTNISADLGNGPGYEWVGWVIQCGCPGRNTITFDFGSVQQFSHAQFFSGNTATVQSGIYLWGTASFQFSDDGITYGHSVTHVTTEAERADTTARYIDTALNQSGRYIRVTFTAGAGPWIFIAEAQFFDNTPPLLTAGTLANGATYASGGLVPGSWAQVKGSGMSEVSRIWSDADFNGLGNSLPANLSEVEVKVNNLAAAIYFVDPGQVSFQVPTGVSGTASVQVFNHGLASNTLTAAAAASAPGIFPVIVKGVNYPAGVFLDRKYVGDPANGSAFRNARPGDAIQLYATGLAVTPAGVLPVSQGVSGVTVTIGAVTVPADFAGLVAVGEFQINFTVPQQFASQPAGNYPISIQVNGVSSPATINSNPPGPLVLPIQH